jgi:hypothetical protein
VSSDVSVFEASFVFYWHYQKAICTQVFQQNGADGASKPIDGTLLKKHSGTVLFS